jgi:hypothetical protein
MPTEDGKTIPALAVTRDHGTLWNSGYTILITLLFVAASKILISWVASCFPLRNNGNRHAILVAFLNIGDPISALLVLGPYQWRLLRRIEVEPESPLDLGVAKRIYRDWKTL